MPTGPTSALVPVARVTLTDAVGAPTAGGIGDSDATTAAEPVRRPRGLCPAADADAELEPPTSPAERNTVDGSAATAASRMLSILAMAARVAGGTTPPMDAIVLHSDLTSMQFSSDTCW